MGAPSPPHELWDMVLDYLACDAHTLLLFALVCKTWTFPSQRRLFSIVNYTDRSTARRTPAILARFLLDTPGLATHIQTLDSSTQRYVYAHPPVYHLLATEPQDILTTPGDHHRFARGRVATARDPYAPP
ncbi:hypothetical protein OH76DRAFT_883825 [Lentinus brumalis]|uniref:F-box domain-containing protein n=1 Tax=Lentinus brumalis TaxID=2498619 RepID=A0A371D188_9APHY|nr:hypothetical protein OH76DRAFT_883825 [Polyporus brumalis]